MEIRHVLLIGIKGDLLLSLYKSLDDAKINYSQYYWPVIESTERLQHPQLNAVNKPFDAVILDCGELTEVAKLSPWGDVRLVEMLNGKFTRNIIVLIQNVQNQKIMVVWRGVRERLSRPRRYMERGPSNTVSTPPSNYLERDVSRIMMAIGRMA